MTRTGFTSESISVKNLGIIIDSKLNFDGEVKKDSSENVLRNKSFQYN